MTLHSGGRERLLLHAGGTELSMVLCDDAVIARMNAEWRGVAAPTDVLSFPIEDDIPSCPGGPPRMLGDIFISLDTAERQAAERGFA